MKNLETKFIVFVEDREGNMTATLKNTVRAARMAYNKIARSDTGQYKTYGFSYANSAYPNERRAAGLTAFPTAHFPQ